MILLAVVWLLQVAVWDPPPELRWDGTLREWPIPWTTCCGSLSRFVLIAGAYLLTWITFIYTYSSFKTFAKVFVFASILAFPFLVYAFMYLYYFGWRG